MSPGVGDVSAASAGAATAAPVNSTVVTGPSALQTATPFAIETSTAPPAVGSCVSAAASPALEVEKGRADVTAHPRLSTNVPLVAVHVRL